MNQRKAGLILKELTKKMLFATQISLLIPNTKFHGNKHRRSGD